MNGSFELVNLLMSVYIETHCPRMTPNRRADTFCTGGH